eukprot:TRINITY_DN13691_c0_g1_i1.p1 TRINITY_DN13691_c0_g1~~TRINITY_DN13691_c0_g1_i1.p1  ORF type:complete len:872 (+),score=156.14 TRINITY_DN13691_c0_g1_i1:93-2708(+)
MQCAGQHLRRAAERRGESRFSLEWLTDDSDRQPHSESPCRGRAATRGPAPARGGSCGPAPRREGSRGPPPLRGGSNGPAPRAAPRNGSRGPAPRAAHDGGGPGFQQGGGGSGAAAPPSPRNAAASPRPQSSILGAAAMLRRRSPPPWRLERGAARWPSPPPPPPPPPESRRTCGAAAATPGSPFLWDDVGGQAGATAEPFLWDDFDGTESKGAHGGWCHPRELHFSETDSEGRGEDVQDEDAHRGDGDASVFCCLHSQGVLHNPSCSFPHASPGAPGRCSLAMTCLRHCVSNRMRRSTPDPAPGCPWFGDLVEIHNSPGPGAAMNGRRGTVVGIKGARTGLPRLLLDLIPADGCAPPKRYEVDSFLVVKLEHPAGAPTSGSASESAAERTAAESASGGGEQSSWDSGTAEALRATGLVPRAEWFCSEQWGWHPVQTCCEGYQPLSDQYLYDHQPSSELEERVRRVAEGGVVAVRRTDGAKEWEARAVAQAVGAVLQRSGAAQGATVTFAEGAMVYVHCGGPGAAAGLLTPGNAAGRELAQAGLELRRAHCIATECAGEGDWALDTNRHTLRGMAHRSVGSAQVLSALRARDGVPRQYVDATYGTGGHTAALLNCDPRHSVAAFDCAPDAAKYAARSPHSDMPQFEFRQTRLGELGRALRGRQFDGFLIDCGLTDEQHVSRARGICHWEWGPLDLRLDPRLTVTAADLLNYAPKVELDEAVSCLKEHPFPPATHAVFVAALQQEREQRFLKNTTQLQRLFLSVLKRLKESELVLRPDRYYRILHQALRNFVNADPAEIAAGVEAALSVLRPGGVLCVLTFRVSERRALEHALRRHERRCGEQLVRLRSRPTAREICHNVRCGCADIWAITRR